ncbi:FKBP-type peptidyl-prolyl cis-trans isomerase [Nocardioides hungaricus]
MPRRLRRLPALLLPLVLATTLVACGNDTSTDKGGDKSTDSSAGGTVQGVTIGGDLGQAPEVTWDGELQTTKTETKVVIEGDGDKLAEGDQVQARLWIGNGTTQKEAYSGFGDGTQPETVMATKNLSPVFRDAILGQTIGSRVAVTTTAAEAFGASGNPSLQIGKSDTVLLIVDLIEAFVPPTPKDVPQSQLPKIVEKGGDVTGLDFGGVDKPDPEGDLLRSVVKEGDGAVVKESDTVTADYLGMVYDAKEPFDESYSQQPVPFGLQSVVKGWTYGLTGLKVGSRVLLQIPPALGYGADNSKPSIPPNSTLYFVVDIRDAKSAG